MKYGIDFGRHGYGNIYIVASGNGGQVGDNCNYDGYANSIYTVTIGESTRKMIKLLILGCKSSEDFDQPRLFCTLHCSHEKMSLNYKLESLR